MRTLRPGDIVTASGICFNPLSPDKARVRIEDIGHALANICRFTGHVRSFYSVAEHSVYVSKLAEYLARRDSQDHYNCTLAAQLGLLHDASEAYLCDVARPLKSQPAFRAYLKAEAKLQQSIIDAFTLCVEDPTHICWSYVHEADVRLVTNEAYALMPVLAPGWSLREGFTNTELEAAHIDPQSLSNPALPGEAKRLFGERAHRIGVAS